MIRRSRPRARYRRNFTIARFHPVRSAISMIPQSSKYINVNTSLSAVGNCDSSTWRVCAASTASSSPLAGAGMFNPSSGWTLARAPVASRIDSPRARRDSCQPAFERRRSWPIAVQRQIRLYEHFLHQFGVRGAVAGKAPHLTCDLRLVPLEQTRANIARAATHWRHWRQSSSSNRSPFARPSAVFTASAVACSIDTSVTAISSSNSLPRRRRRRRTIVAIPMPTRAARPVARRRRGRHLVAIESRTRPSTRRRRWRSIALCIRPAGPAAWRRRRRPMSVMSGRAVGLRAWTGILITRPWRRAIRRRRLSRGRPITTSR